MVLQHLAANAEQHGARNLIIDISAADDTAAKLTIADDGPGISAGNRERVFDPFFTTRRDDGGTGMGLTIVRAMLEAHQSSIRLVETESGARFELHLPLAGAGMHKIS
jgi:signal transduction histidine kinase